MSIADYVAWITPWTPARLEKLREICQLGSMQWVAETLSRETGHKFTRNGIIGKMNRMGLKGQPAPKHRQALKPKPEPVYVPPPPVRVVIQEQQPSSPLPFLCVSIFDLELEQCRYPQGDDPVVYCGQRQQDSSSYCAFHHRLCHTSFTPNAERFVNPVRIA